MSDKPAPPAPVGKPLPDVADPFNARFWQGLGQNRLLLQTCSDCQSPRFPASRYCPHCHSEACEWLDADGAGVVVSFCTFHKAYWPGFAAEVPYSVVQVRLNNGVQFFSPGLIKKVLSPYMHDACTRYFVNGSGLNIAVR